MVRVGARLHSRWVAATVLAGAFIALGDLTAAVVVLFAWAPPTLVLLALQGGHRRGDGHRAGPRVAHR